MEQLSDEILLSVFKRLLHKDCTSLRLTCKRFNQLCNDPSLHVSLDVAGCFHYYHVSLQRHLSRFKDHLQHLTITDCYWIPPFQFQQALRSCNNLILLNVIGSPLTANGLANVFKINPNIKVLHWTIQSTLTPDYLQYCDDGEGTVLQKLTAGFLKLDMLSLQFISLKSFETFLPVLSPDMLLRRLSLEYTGDHAPCSTTFLSSVASGYNFLVCSDVPFSIFDQDGIRNNSYLHFNLLFMGFVMRVVYCAAEKDNLTALLASGTINSLCWRYINRVYGSKSLTRLDLTHVQLSVEQMEWLNSLPNLVSLCLRGVTHLKANLVKAIAVNCVHLTSLNLSDSDGWIDQDLCAIETISVNCRYLRELNLTGVHIHPTLGAKNKLCILLSTMESLRALGLPACSIANCNVPPTPAGRPHFSTLVTGSIFESTSSGCITRNQTHQKVQKLELSTAGNGLKDLQPISHLVTDLEIIDKDFTSPFSHFKSSGSLVCPVTRTLQDAVFSSLANWTSLRCLSLAGLPSLGAFHSLIDVTETCQSLELLNLAYIGLPGNSSCLLSLPKALTYCKNLKTFRLDQPNYIMSDSFLTALQNCKKLETLCIINKNGRIVKSLTPFTDLLKKCPRLVVVQSFSGDLKSKCHRFQIDISKRFKKKRPPLSVTIATYSQALTQSGLASIPYIHLRDLTHFRSRIASGV